MVCLLASTILLPLASGYEELELQSSTDALPALGFATVDHVFWRSSFGAPVLGGPTFAGSAAQYDAFRNQSETSTGGVFPNGALPVFIEYRAVSDPVYASGNGSDTDYSTQRWNSTSGDRVAGAASLGAGAAAQAALAQEFLGTNHEADGTQSPSGALIGASNDTGLMGLFLVQALSDRVAALAAGGAYNGSALGAFDLGDPNLTDDDPSNGWQIVPDAMVVDLGSTFQGFTAQDNASSLAGQGALILGLAEVVRLSNPTGDWGALFDGDPLDSSLYDTSRALLGAVANNARAYHWDATAGTYDEPDRASVDTGDLALFARALSVAEVAAASDAALKDSITPLRESAVAALAMAAGTGGKYAATYTLSGSTVTPDSGNTSLWGQAQVIEAMAASYAVTGLKADFDAMLAASAGLESGLFRGGSYAAASPETGSTTYTGAAVAALVGALRDLALSGEEPLAVYRFVDAYDTLVAAPPLTLSGAQAPPIVGAAFSYNTSNATALPATGFDALSAMLAAYEFASTGARFNLAVGGGVSITEAATLRLHAATAVELGVAFDALDQQIAALQVQLDNLQAQFDAINSTASDVEDRLNLSLENESISLARIQDLIDNVTALRAQLNQSQGSEANATALFDNVTKTLEETRLELANLTEDLADAQNATSQALGALDLEHENRTMADQRADLTQSQLDDALNDRNAAQANAAFAAIAGVLAGFALFYVVNRFVMNKPLGTGTKDDGTGEREDEDEDEEDEDED